MSLQKVKLDICGSTYVVSTNDSEEYLTGLAERLDRDMNQIMLEAPNASVTSAAVITALSYLDEAAKSAFSADNMRKQIQGYLEDAAKARTDAERAKRDVERLKREIAYLEGKSPADKKVQPKPQEPLLDYGQNKEEDAPAKAAEEGDQMSLD